MGTLSTNHGIVDNPRALRRLWRACSLVVGGFMLSSAFLKAISLEQFAILISQYGISRHPGIVVTLAIVVIYLEAIVGGLFVACVHFEGWVPKTGATFIIALTLVFLYGLIFEGIQECGCLGFSIRLGIYVTLLKNVALLALIGIVLLCARHMEIPSASEEWNELIRDRRRLILMALFLIGIGMALLPEAFRPMPLLEKSLGDGVATWQQPIIPRKIVKA